MFWYLNKLGGYTSKSIIRSDIGYKTSSSPIDSCFITRFENDRAFFDILHNVQTREIIQVWVQSNENKNLGYIYTSCPYIEDVLKNKHEIWVGRFQPIMIEKSSVSKNIIYENDKNIFLDKLNELYVITDFKPKTYINKRE